MARIYFSIEEAEEFIQKNKDKIKHLMDLNEETEAMNFIKLDYVDEDPEAQTKMLEMSKNYHKTMAELYDGLHQLLSEGCMMKDIEKGLIDFYSKFNNQDIMLCWKVGEDKLIHWHTIQGGYTARQSIDVLKKEYEQKLQKLI